MKLWIYHAVTFGLGPKLDEHVNSGLILNTAGFRLQNKSPRPESSRSAHEHISHIDMRLIMFTSIRYVARIGEGFVKIMSQHALYNSALRS